MYAPSELAALDAPDLYATPIVNSGVLMGTGQVFVALLAEYTNELHAHGVADCRWPRRKGAIGKGRTRGLRRFAQRGAEWWIPDQLVLNYMAIAGDGRHAVPIHTYELAPQLSVNATTEPAGATVVLQRNEDGLIYHVGDNGPLGFLPPVGRAPTEFRANVRNSWGSEVAAVLHQFDRAPALANAIAKHFEEPVKLWG